MLTRSEIQSRVPHAGSMCLLDTVSSWDATTIVCEAEAPTSQHPLADAGRVPAVVGVEYAAQAAAVHGSLLDATVAPREGMLAKLSEVALAPGYLDGPLRVRAELISRVAAGCMYAFTVHDAHRCCARGRLLVAFRP